ncbi:MAG TPA: NADH-quinone oxidoreductase subunit M [Opitutaceae bacterium]|nr:NADH-quinone oxidoreductase subunit M [Opitutaceae bacterium]
MNGFPWLTLIVFLPWAGAALLALLPKLDVRAGRVLALVFSLSTLVVGLALLPSFKHAAAGYAFTEDHAWIAALQVNYHLGLDGLSLVLVLLTGLVAPGALLASWRETRDPRFFHILFLLLQGSALGVFLALNFFLWFIFWELSLVPAFFLIKLWGGAGASRAAYQFIIYTMAGSACMLLGFAAIFAVTGTLDLARLATLAADGTLAAKLAVLGGFWPKAVFLGVFLGLAVKVPLFPFHTWLPAAYAEAPVGVSMFLTGVMSKMGVYGFFRILWPLFPGPLQAASGVLLWLALGGVVLGAFAALRQTDLKRMVAYSSINHVSYCLLALFAVTAATGGVGADGGAAAALSGAVLQMFNHGISAAALFFCIGVLESRSGGRRGRDEFGGVRSAAPVFAGLCGLAMFSSLGLPGLNGFIGEFLIFRGVFALAPWAAAAGCLGLLVTAIFLLTFYQRVFHGPRAGAAAVEFRDLSGRELAVLVPATALMLLLGVLPQILIGLYNPLISFWTAHLP